MNNEAMSDRDHQWKFFEHLWKVEANKAEREFAFKSGWDACEKIKQEEIDHLQSKLDCAVNALEFYDDLKNWGW